MIKKLNQKAISIEGSLDLLQQQYLNKVELLNELGLENNKPLNLKQVLEQVLEEEINFEVSDHDNINEIIEKHFDTDAIDKEIIFEYIEQNCFNSNIEDIWNTVEKHNEWKKTIDFNREVLFRLENIVDKDYINGVADIIQDYYIEKADHIIGELSLGRNFIEVIKNLNNVKAS